MYHYVRPVAEGLPHQRFLAIDDFRRQLDWFDEHGGIVSVVDLLAAVKAGSPCEGFVLTFDDGFRDHFAYVLPELVDRRLTGVFFVATSPYTSGHLLDVHRIQLLLGTHGGSTERGTPLQTLLKLVTEDMIPDRKVEEFRTQTYVGVDDDQDTVLFKRTLNYFVAYELRGALLDNVIATHPVTCNEVGEFYMSTAELDELRGHGQLVGSHSTTHRVFSKLSQDEQRAEIDDSFAFLEMHATIRQPRSFCFPYGGFHTFTQTTERLLDRAGAVFSFNVEARDIGAADLRHRPQALPRYDCNGFPHGTASSGAPSVQITGPGTRSTDPFP